MTTETRRHPTNIAAIVQKEVERTITRASAASTCCSTATSRRSA